MPSPNQMDWPHLSPTTRFYPPVPVSLPQADPLTELRDQVADLTKEVRRLTSYLDQRAYSTYVDPATLARVMRQLDGGK